MKLLSDAVYAVKYRYFRGHASVNTMITYKRSYNNFSPAAVEDAVKFDLQSTVCPTTTT